MKLKFAHIINPFNPGTSATEAKIQAITIECMRRAAKEYDPEQVTFVSAQFEEDLKFVPEGFIATENLPRSINEVSKIIGKKKLPILADIIQRLKNFEADYYIYSNTDISPYPNFYTAIAQLINQSGADALIVNRRRLPTSFIDKNIEEMVRENGLPHPGYDCFVFKKTILPKLDLKNVAVGIPGIGFMFAHNLFLKADLCKVLYNEKLTFHIGMEIIKEWSSKEEVNFQHQEIISFLNENRKQFDVSKFPGYHLPFFKRHYRWLMNPLFHYPTMFRIDMKKLFDGRKIVREEVGGLGSFSVYSRNFDETK